jgi:LysM repeat protein
VAETSASGQDSRRISWGNRILAPLALIAVVVAILSIVFANTGQDNKAEQDTKSQIANEKSGKKKSGPENPRNYTVEQGDTLGGIAEKFNVSTKRLERLNPDIDPQTLNAGQELQIR